MIKLLMLLTITLSSSLSFAQSRVEMCACPEPRSAECSCLARNMNFDCQTRSGDFVKIDMKLSILWDYSIFPPISKSITYDVHVDAFGQAFLAKVSHASRLYSFYQDGTFLEILENRMGQFYKIKAHFKGSFQGEEGKYVSSLSCKEI